MMLVVTAAATPNESVGWDPPVDGGRLKLMESFSVYPVGIGPTPIKVFVDSACGKLLVAVRVSGDIVKASKLLEAVDDPPEAWVKFPVVELNNVPAGPVGAVKPLSIAVTDRVPTVVVPVGIKT